MMRFPPLELPLEHWLAAGIWIVYSLATTDRLLRSQTPHAQLCAFTSISDTAGCQPTWCPPTAGMSYCYADAPHSTTYRMERPPSELIADTEQSLADSDTS